MIIISVPSSEDLATLNAGVDAAATEAEGLVRPDEDTEHWNTISRWSTTMINRIALNKEENILPDLGPRY